MTEITAKGWEQHAEACRRRLAQGDSAGAEASFAAALADGEALGADSAQLAACLTVLAQVRSQQRDHAAAELLFRRALEVRERAAEFDHVSVIQILGHLATLHNARADYDEAESLLVRALSLADKFLTAAHPAVASLLNNLARLYFKRTDYPKADRMLVRLLQIKQAQGTEHPEVAGVLASIAALRSALGKHDVAEQLWRRVLAIREKSLPHNDPTLITTLNSLADACAAQGDQDEALHFRERGLRLQAHALGSDHPEVAATQSNVAGTREGTPTAPHASVASRASVPTPSASLVPPIQPITPITVPAPPRLEVEATAPPSVVVQPPAPPEVPRQPVAPPRVQQSRITPIPLAPIAPAPRPTIAPFSPGTSGEFSPGAGADRPGGTGGGTAPGAAAGFASFAPPPAQPVVVAGIGPPPPLPDPVRSPSQPSGLAQPFGSPPAVIPPRVVSAPTAPPPPCAVPHAPPPAAPARHRSEPSLERPRYEGYEHAAPAPRRGVVGKVIVGLAAAAGIGFAAITFSGADTATEVEASTVDTIAAEPRLIRIPAESLRVSRGAGAAAPSRPTITLDSALAASRAHNALDSGAVAGATDSLARTPTRIVVPSQRSLEALSRAVDAGLKRSVDSAVRAPAPKTPDFQSP